jgi:putative tryptophan/tyrosine transport system substrate-binding protein
VSVASAIMRTALLISAVLSLALARADQPAPIPRIGVLNVPIEEFLRQALRDLGYIEGKNIAIESRRSSASERELQSLASELVRSKVDVIVTAGSPTARAVLAATATIPVVFSAGDPVATGLVTSLVKPGGNATGVSVLSTELMAKRVDFLHQLAPRARRVACLMNSSNPIAPLQLEEAQKAARAFGMRLIALDARNEAELDAELHKLPRLSVDGFLVTVDLFLMASKSKIARAVRKARLPAIYPYREYLGEGTLASYGPNLNETARKLAAYVDKILKGAKPGDLPIEQLSKYELVIDLRAARELNIKVPQELLYRADEVIE